MSSRYETQELEVEGSQAELSEHRSRPLSRRTVMRRAALGVTGVGLTALLAACGEDDEGDVRGTGNELVRDPSNRTD